MKNLYPYEYVDSVFSVDYQKLYQMGYRGIIFDIDNTLVHHGEDSNKEIDDLFKSLHLIGFKTVLLSDNSEKRVKSFIKNINTPYICNAHKPNKESIYKAVSLLELEKEQIIYFGDQIFLDIYGANKCNIPNILVKYLRYSNETKIGKKRTIEKYILKHYLKSKKYCHRIGDVLLKKDGTL